MISDIFIVSCHNTVLAAKSYRFDCEGTSKDVFVQKLREVRSSQLPPHFKENGTTFYYVKRNSMYFVATSQADVSPIFVIEILSRIYQTCKDFCGVVNEESIRVNSLLVFEVLDEILDYGYVQLATTEKLRPYIQSDPVIIKSTREPTSDLGSRMFGIEMKVTPGSASSKPLVSSSADSEHKKNEVFVDVIERLTAVINSDGTVSRLEANGSINMKNFLSDSPEIKIGLNEDLAIKAGALKAYGDQVQLDHCSFHQKVKLEEFEKSRVLKIQPSVGELSLMTYSVSGEGALSPPFRISPFVDNTDSSQDMLLTVRLKSESPVNTQAVNVCVRIPVPHNTTSVSQHLDGPGQMAELRQKIDNKNIIWKIKKLPGQTEVMARFRVINQGNGKLNKQELGPMVVEFEISKYTCSGLKVRFLHIPVQDPNNTPHRWVRCMTVSDSYLVKI
ncbi:AP-4 complex subunit mu-1-like [Mizuhopecten yessoensis]|uniref:AP-4 complex subunit mu-1 n=1 Tax=Mizuhopecten yessoensis TaxID=6573 RepID=A0A210Q3P3_MIZYE|nr:AP-4 complex subunit mu-1-like [Mizuhopecten yessoensis]OWF43363.1 AP-4 complex subunit mu-1 [Mizuhopecten yessoensis]